MAATVYRSVKVVVQNSTNEMLTIQGVATLTGEWVPKMEPIQDTQIAEQSAAEWMAQSTIIGVGVSAFVRLGSSTGFITIKWSQPWSGPFTAEAFDPSGDSLELDINDRHPDNVIIMAVISNQSSD